MADAADGYGRESACFPINVDSSLTVDSAVLSLTGTDHVKDSYQHTLTLDYSQTAALTNNIEAK